MSLQYSQVRSFRLRLSQELQDSLSLSHLYFIYFWMFLQALYCQCNRIASVPLLAPPWARTRSTSTTATFEASLPITLQGELLGEQLLQVSERVTFETLLARTPLTSQPFHIGCTSLIPGVDRLEVINSAMLEALRRVAGRRGKVLFE